MSVITLDMVDQFASFHGISLDDGSQFPGVRGSLEAWEAGRGSLEAALVNGNPSFYPLVEAYYKALGQEVPESVKQPLVDPSKKENTTE